MDRALTCVEFRSGRHLHYYLAPRPAPAMICKHRAQALCIFGEISGRCEQIHRVCGQRRSNLSEEQKINAFDDRDRSTFLRNRLNCLHFETAEHFLNCAMPPYGQKALNLDKFECAAGDRSDDLLISHAAIENWFS